MIIDIYKEMQRVCLESEIDHHESDLYVPVTLATTNIVDMYQYKNNVTTFRCQITGRLYYDIPFAYPYRTNEQPAVKIKTLLTQTC
jgi:hypothetical protein